MGRRSVAVLFLLALFCAVALLLPPDTASTANDAGYTLSWWTVDGGGDQLDGNGYTLSSTAGQHDASVWQGGGYILTGGFWGGRLARHSIYLPLVIRD